jgi:hypothetical protein
MQLVRFKRGQNLRVLEMAREIFLREHGEVVDYYETSIISHTRIPAEMLSEEEKVCCFTGASLYHSDEMGYLRPKKQMRFCCLSGKTFYTIFKLVQVQRALGYSGSQASQPTFDQTIFDGDLFKLFGLQHSEEDPHAAMRRQKIQDKWDLVVQPFLIFWRFVPITKDNLLRYMEELREVEEKFVDAELLSLHPATARGAVRPIFMSKIMELTGVSV